MGIICQKVRSSFLGFWVSRKAAFKGFWVPLGSTDYLWCSIKVHFVEDMSMKIWVLWRVRDSISPLTAETKDIKHTEEDDTHEEDEEEAQNQPSQFHATNFNCVVSTLVCRGVDDLTLGQFQVAKCLLCFTFFWCPLQYGNQKNQNLWNTIGCSWLFGILGSIYSYIPYVVVS